MIKAVIFDVDGTLVDSNLQHIEAWREAFAHFGKELSADEIHAQVGKGGDQLMPVFLSEAELERRGEEIEAHRGGLRRDLPRRRRPAAPLSAVAARSRRIWPMTPEEHP